MIIFDLLKDFFFNTKETEEVAHQSAFTVPPRVLHCMTKETSFCHVDVVAIETGLSMTTCAFYLCRASDIDMVSRTVCSVNTGSSV